MCAGGCITCFNFASSIFGGETDARRFEAKRTASSPAVTCCLTLTAAFGWRKVNLSLALVAFVPFHLLLLTGQ